MLQANDINTIVNKLKQFINLFTQILENNSLMPRNGINTIQHHFKIVLN